MAIMSNINFKGFDVKAYVSIQSVSISKQYEIIGDVENQISKQKLWAVFAEVHLFNNEKKTHFLESSTIVFTMDNIFDLEELLWSKIKEKYQGTDLL